MAALRKPNGQTHEQFVITIDVLRDDSESFQRALRAFILAKARLFDVGSIARIMRGGDRDPLYDRNDYEYARKKKEATE